MKCHYEILGVPLDVEHDELKKSYRKLALKWHPDKNPNNQTQAKEQFQLIQQAYDILNDPQERSWYDRHRDAILRGGLGGDYKDTSLDVFPYFTTTCYKGYTDEPEGFYAVYREVFNKIAAEDLEFSDDPEVQVPGFGTLSCDYETVVHSFYGHWAAYSTKKTYSWLEPYDARDTPNRRVLRLVEKENKKIRDKARRERNEAVRSLVAFVRKRDRRVHAWARELERRAAANVLRAQQRREQAVRDRRAQMHAEPSWAQFASVENELRAIEAKLAQDDPCDDDDDDEEEAFYCAACNKVFKTCKAFGNHEQSKKHREGVAALRASLIDEDADVEEEEEDEDEEEESDDEQDSDEVLEEVRETKEVKDDKTDTMLEDHESAPAELAAKEETQSESDEPPEQVQPKTDRLVTEPAALAGSDSDESALETNRKQRRRAERKDSEEEVPAPRKLKGKKAKDARKRARAAADTVTVTTPMKGPGQVANGTVGSKAKPEKVEVTASAKEPGKEEVAGEEMAVVKGVKDDWQERVNKVEGDGKEVDEEMKGRVCVTSDNENIADAVEVKVWPNGSAIDESRVNEVTDKSNLDNSADKSLSDVKSKSKVNKDAEDKGKARANNAEEAAARRGGRSKKDLAYACAACHRGFPSKNKLFEHLKATGHAVALSEPMPLTEKRPGRKNRAN